MFTVYIFCVKMHERYLFPVLLSLLLTYVFTKDKRFLLSFAGTSFFHFLNVAYVLYLNNAYIEPTAPQILLLSLAQILMYVYTLYAVWRVFLAKKAPAPLALPKREKPAARRAAAGRSAVTAGNAAPSSPLLAAQNRNVRLTRTDVLLLCAVTLAYGLVAFWNLGDRQTANTTWTPENGESVIFSTEDAYSEIYFLPGIAPADDGIGQRVGVSMRVEVSDDGENWTLALDNTEGSVYAWKSETALATGKYIRITPTCDDLAINEFALKKADGTGFATLTAVRGEASALTDEQNVVPLYPSYMNSTYFDEIYHARTAYEHILGLEPYENTHPPLGKLIISLGIRIFGMNPFGWRFMGTLFGVLMLPILYHLLKRLFGSTVPVHGRHGALRLRLHALRADAHRDDRHVRRVLHPAHVRRDARLPADRPDDGRVEKAPAAALFQRPVQWPRRRLEVDRRLRRGRARRALLRQARRDVPRAATFVALRRKARRGAGRLLAERSGPACGAACSSF